MNAGLLWIIFSVSFLMALSGALMPGPLLAYTVARSVRSSGRGFLVGARVIAGHAAVETLILGALVLGVGELLKAPAAIKTIGVAGALLLFFMGAGMLREIFKNRSSGEARGAEDTPAPANGMSPFLAGVLVSMSNPYWWLWWLTVGSATLIRFGVTVRAWQGLAAFFIGHELADLGWYSTVSTLCYFGRRGLSRGLYNAVLGVCATAIIGFGLYLGVSIFWKT
jgi:threonine/homoserine/homoserine lactone efflux protein